ncbi:DASH family cryptochrome [Mongoliitalea lutea]|uniref:Cryptochrome DASH n=1 Tax=Mongoliitalea lutea TaxID=849756 RepID=A0A8J3CVQ8_9BACT|nr:DASH family cryptochrome [Mongoliitalea lutea]GHB30822.1 cryptochrome DASH [Mongoliitalea lutea]
MNKNRVVVWFRNDLRVHDNASLFSAVKKYEEVIPVYCYDERQFETIRLGLPKTGAHRAKFLIESVENLKHSLQGKGSNLLVLKGKPEELVVTVAEKYQASAIFFSEEVTDEEKRVEVALEQNAWAKGIKTEVFWQSTLFHLQDLPFPVNQTPEVFTQFRKECEKFVRIQKVFSTPDAINTPAFTDAETNEVSLKVLGLNEPEIPSSGVLRFEGGESAALGRLQAYFWEQDLLKVYKETRNGLLGADYSSKFSPWLALGCISPKYIYWEVLRYEKERKKNQSTYWLIFELIWRDYFRFICKKHGNKVFQLKGIRNVEEQWSRNESMFWRWAEGQTGIPFVDANMRELNHTGFMSNRGRQNVASFLVNDLGIDWRWGASYFESMLIDYDVCSNWGNWMYVAGVGNDPRENRYFNILKQAQNYDRKGDYIRHWIPELARIPGFDIHQPHTLHASDLRKYQVSLGGNYPHPVVKMKAFSY